MPTPGERRALLFLAALAALGVSVRACSEMRGPAPVPIAGDRAGLARQIEAVDSAISVGGAKRQGRAARKGATPARKEPGTAAAPAQEPRLPRERRARADAPPRALATTGSERRPPALQPDPAQPTRGRRSSPPAMRPPVDLDTAPLDEIAALPAIGPALARRIVSDRIEHGPFGSINGLERVQGIGHSLARRFQPWVTFSLPARPDRGVPPQPVAQKRRAPGGASTRP